MTFTHSKITDELWYMSSHSSRKPCFMAILLWHEVDNSSNLNSMRATPDLFLSGLVLFRPFYDRPKFCLICLAGYLVNASIIHGVVIKLSALVSPSFERNAHC